MTTYKVITIIKEVGNQTRLVEAKTQAMALFYVATDLITVEKATPKELVSLGAQGLVIEDAAKD